MARVRLPNKYPISAIDASAHVTGSPISTEFEIANTGSNEKKLINDPTQCVGNLDSPRLKPYQTYEPECTHNDEGNHPFLAIEAHKPVPSVRRRFGRAVPDILHS